MRVSMSFSAGKLLVLGIHRHTLILAALRPPSAPEPFADMVSFEMWP